MPNAAFEINILEESRLMGPVAPESTFVRLVFFFGAGSSMSVGLPGIVNLTKTVMESLDDDARKVCETIAKELSASQSNIENLLDRIRLYQELVDGKEEPEYVGMKGISFARKIDAAVCKTSLTKIG